MRTLTIAGGVLLVLLWGTGASAQVPSWYEWHNQVEPTLQVAVTLDEATGDFRYRYTVSNAAGAAQRIETLRFELPVVPSAMAAPVDWEYSFDAATPVVGWWAVGAPEPGWTPINELDEHIPSTISEIAPGETLSGFDVLSPCAAADALTWYARGYAHAALRPEDDESEWVQLPGWREDAVTGTAVGPGDCSTVRDWGNRRPGVDGFLGLVNFADGAALPAGPVTVQLRFSRGGEVVDRSTLRVELNRVDVTAAFRTNSIGDAVAIFVPGASPLTSGSNVLLVSVEGTVPGTTRTGTDADRFTFTLP